MFVEKADAKVRDRPEMQTKRRWTRSPLLWKRVRILLWADALPACGARWVCWLSTSLGALGQTIRLPAGLKGERRGEEPVREREAHAVTPLTLSAILSHCHDAPHTVCHTASDISPT